jgi:hypothetical protein
MVRAHKGTWCDLRHRGAVAVCAIFTSWLGVDCEARAQAPPVTQSNAATVRGALHEASPPRVRPTVQAVAGTAWNETEIQAEQARCTQLLRGLDIVARPVPPVRENECGAAAPVEVISVGKSPQVALSPPVTVTCDLAVALHRWITKDIQSLARKHLEAPVVRIDTMSSYSCRTAYGRKNARLSEHGRANALDIKSFTAANGKTADVLADWGPTGHEIAAQVATAKRETERAAAHERALAASRQAPAAAQPAQTGAVAAAPADKGIATGSLPAPTGLADMTRPTISLGTRGAGTVGLPMPQSPPTGLSILNGIGQPSRLGGPKTQELATPILPGKIEFLRGAHASACHVFGTVLGPEANAAHRNHFHVDMAERKVRSICE